MSLIAIVLVVVSAFIHAGWNLLSKSRQPSAAFFLVAGVAGALLLLPVLVAYGAVLGRGIPLRVWGFLVLTGFFMALYYVALAGAYRSGDISVAYPLARSSPVIVVLVVALILGRSDQVTARCVIGIVLVVAGCLLIPLVHFRELRPGHYLNATCGLALLAACGTSGYSIVDDEALRLLRDSPDVALSTTQVTLLYACLQSLAAVAWLALFVGVRRDGRASLRAVLRCGAWHAAAAGAAIHIGYALVLVALAFVDNVSYVVGFRQLCIPLGAAVGIWVLKEPAHKPKLAGLAIMVAGLLLIAAG